MNEISQITQKNCLRYLTAAEIGAYFTSRVCRGGPGSQPERYIWDSCGRSSHGQLGGGGGGRDTRSHLPATTCVVVSTSAHCAFVIVKYYAMLHVFPCISQFLSAWESCSCPLFSQLLCTSRPLCSRVSAPPPPPPLSPTRLTWHTDASFLISGYLCCGCRASSVPLALPFLNHAQVATMETHLVLRGVRSVHRALLDNIVLDMASQNLVDHVMQASIAVEELTLL